MICKSTIVLFLLGIGYGSSFRYNGEGYRYHGPPAPLNPDGTVAFTPEYEHIRAEHRAAFEREYQKVRNSIYAADPYSITNLPKPYGNKYEEQHLPEIHEHDLNDSPSPLEDEGQYNPELYEKPYSSQYDDGQYRPHLYEQEQQNDEVHNSPLAQDTSYKPAYVPATLNEDGTVAHTPEYNAIASSFLAYHQALSRHRRSVERYQGPPAPLKHDLTVDFTPEVKNVNAAHFTAVANQFKRLQATAALAAAHPDRSSPPSKDYNPQTNGQYKPFIPQGHSQGQFHGRKKRSYSSDYRPQQSNPRNYDDGQYKPQLYHVVDYNTVPYHPAPLNPDGTVAHLPEYHAIAASHLAAHHHALSSVAH